MSANWQNLARQACLKHGQHIGDSPSVPPPNVRLAAFTVTQNKLHALFEAWLNNRVPEFAKSLADMVYAFMVIANAYGIELDPLISAVHEKAMEDEELGVERARELIEGQGFSTGKITS